MLTLETSNQSLQQQQQQSQQSLGFEAFGFTVKGRRSSNEDTFLIMNHLNEVFGLKDVVQKQSFYGVFDGHSGFQAAEYARIHLYANIVRDELFSSNVGEAIRRGFLKTDDLFNEKASSLNLTAGTCAITTLLRGDRAYIANLGDSKAVLCRRGMAKDLSVAHKASREDERQRIENDGGKVVSYGTWRVNGMLAVSRSIGDHSLKRWVIAEPDIEEIVLEEGDEFILLASDGLWDVFSSQEAVDFVRSRLSSITTAVDKTKLCEELCNEAVTKESQDNVTVLLVVLNHNNPHSTTTNNNNNNNNNGDGEDALLVQTE
jgi:protein phosphatase 1L